MLKNFFLKKKKKTSTGPSLWVGGAIKSVPSLGNVMNVVSLDVSGNFSQSTVKLLSPIARFVVSSLFFTKSGAMVTISRDDRSQYAEFR